MAVVKPRRDHRQSQIQPRPNMTLLAYRPNSSLANYGRSQEQQRYNNFRGSLQQRQSIRPVAAIYQPFGESPAPQSPDSLQSTGSAANSGTYGTSHRSGSTYGLDRRRGLSPHTYTPRSSQGSLHEFYPAQGLPTIGSHGVANLHYNSFQPTIAYGEYSQLPTNCSESAFPAPNSAHETLQGLGRSPSDITGPPTIGVLAPPLGRKPAHLRPSPVSSDVWTGHPFRYENPGAGTYGTDPNGRDDSGDSGDEENTSTPRMGVRNGPLSVEKREEVNETRKFGACLRCFLYKEPCDCNTVCKKCTVKFRKWKLGCVRVWLEERWKFLQPEPLGANLSIQKFNTFIKSNAYNMDYSATAHFILYVSWVLGPPIRIRVKEVKPFGNELLQYSGFRASHQTDDFSAVLPVEIASPPLVPVSSIPSKREFNLHIKGEIKAWMHAIIHDENQYFPWHCFWDESENWQRDILFAIWEYHQADMEEHQVLTDVVREEDVEGLFQRLKHPDLQGKVPHEPVSPKAIDRCVKVMAYPLVEGLARKTLKDLQEMLLAKSDSPVQRDLVFCLTFLVMIVIGKNQDALHLGVLQRRRRPEEGLSMDEAQGYIREMERELVDHIIALFQWSSEPSQKPPKKKPVTMSSRPSPAEAHSAEFKLFARLQNVTAEAENPPLGSGLEGLDEDNFSGKNVERLLAKFYNSVLSSIR